MSYPFSVHVYKFTLFSVFFLLCSVNKITYKYFYYQIL